ncbi:MAG: BatA and WFA domain-containing protein [Planctomycetota bacterium]
MSFLAPAGLFLLLLTVPIVLLWMFRQRREPLTVPTNFLWRRAAEEQRVSPVIRNLIRSILLLLQLAAIVLLALAGANAVLDLALEGRARRIVILLDRSASMGTVEENGETRLDAAKDRIRDLLGNFRRADRAMLVTFHRTARIASGFTEDEDALLALLNGLVPADCGTDPAVAFRIADAALAALPPRAAEVFLISDGAFPALPEFPARLSDAPFSFVGVGKASANAGIVGIDVTTGLERESRAFLRIANAGDETAVRTVTLGMGGDALDAREISIAPRSVAPVVFDLGERGVGAYEVRLSPGDALPADDTARFVRREVVFRRILLVTNGNPVLESLKKLHPTLEIYAIPPDGTPPDVGRFDLTIFDGLAPEGLLPGHGPLGPSAVWIDCVPRDEKVSLAIRGRNPELVDWNRRHPLNRDVDWSEVLLSGASVIQAGESAVPLVEINAGPVAVALPGPGTRIVLGFRLEESSLPLRVGFPIFFANVLESAFRQGSSGDRGYVAGGDTYSRLLPPGVGSASVETPSGATIDLGRLPDGSVAFSDTDRAGFYQVTWTDGLPGGEVFAVCLTDEAEADIRPRTTVDLAGETKESDPAAVQANFPLRRTLLGTAIAILLLEWLLWLRGGRRRAPPRV